MTRSRDQTQSVGHDRGRVLNWAPGTATMLVSTIVGLLAFVSVLLYSPIPERNPEAAPTADLVRPWVRQNAIGSISRGRDEQAINQLLEHLQTDPDFGWGWRIVYQLASRDEALAEQRDQAAARLAELTRPESYDEQWPWDRRTRGLIHMIAGRTTEARSTLARGIDLVNNDPAIGPGNAAFLEAAMLAIGDQPDEALAALERAVEQERYLNSRWLRTTPDLDSLRDDPRLEALIARSEELERRPDPVAQQEEKPEHEPEEAQADRPDDRPDHRPVGEPDLGPGDGASEPSGG